jgi:hypothetical protein
VPHPLNEPRKDDGGALIPIEFLLVSVILVLGVVVGLANVRAALNAEWRELARAFLAQRQGHTLPGQGGSSAAVGMPNSVMGPVSTPPTAPVIDVPTP